MSCVSETTIFGDRNFPLATILKMKVAKKRLIEKMSLERWRTTCNDLFGEAQLKRGIFSGIRDNYERMGISQVKVYERAGKSQ